MPLPAGTRSFRIVLYSTPTVLAEGGVATETVVTIPAGISGDHTLVLWAVVDGEVVVQGLPITVGAAPPRTIPATGSDPRSGVQLALLLIGLGLTLIAARRRSAR